MKVDLNTFAGMPTPAYVLEEARLESNLQTIAGVAKRADVEIILAFKAYALWKTFPIFRRYISATTASSLWEARLGYEEFGAPTHTFSPAYKEEEIDDIARFSSHISFNSLSQYDRWHLRARSVNPQVSLGIRVNPEYSEVETLIYNPCAPGSRFGVKAALLPEQLPADVEGFHCHTLCESGPDVFARTLSHIEEKFTRWFPQLKWINFGGGHLMTRADYDTDRLVRILQDFHSRYPWLHVVLEPGSAFGWQTGPLVSQVVDIVGGGDEPPTAILDVSFTCHMPDCLEMPYHPRVRGARTVEENAEQWLSGEARWDADKQDGEHLYRFGGNSCLSGDYMGFWAFDHELQVGERIIFEDMLHYTTVKTNTFNGIVHPSILLASPTGQLTPLRVFTYDDYKARMD